MSRLQVGLYSSRFEHDSCGVGFVVDIRGRRSHDIVRDGLRVLAAQRDEARQDFMPARAVAFDQFAQGDAVLEGTVHALAVKGHDGVGGIADQQSSVGTMPDRATQRAERAGRVGMELPDPVG